MTTTDPFTDPPEFLRFKAEARKVYLRERQPRQHEPITFTTRITVPR